MCRTIMPKRQQMIDFIVATAALDIELATFTGYSRIYFGPVPGHFDIMDLKF